MTKFAKSKSYAGGGLFAVAALALMAGPAVAADVCLAARALTPTYPDGGAGTAVTMWGYASAPWTAAGCEWASAGAASVPGPRITVPVGDSTLNIHLLNDLPEATSLVIPGQVAPLTPVRDASGRIRSLAHETLPAGEGLYSWANLAPGTYLYRSGTMQAVQVQMGLYGAVTHDSAVGEAYPGVPYAEEAVLLYSEVDPALHAAVATGNYGPGGTVTSTIDYNPKFFLINGRPFDPAVPGSNEFPATQGSRVLLRLLSASINSHEPNLEGARMDVVAEDGNKYPFPRNQYSVLLPAESTHDAIVTFTRAGRYGLIDRMLSLTNNGAGPGGMMAFLNVKELILPAAVADAYTTAEDVALAVPAPGVLGNDIGVSAVMVQNVPAATGSVTLAANGSFNYLPALNFNGTATFTYKAIDGALQSAPASVTITVNPMPDAPVAVGESYSTPFATALAVAAPGVLGNDSDPDGDPLTAVIVANSTHGTVTLNPDGSFSYAPTPNSGFSGADSFTYQASDGVLLSAITTVNIIVAANQAPVAVGESYNTLYETALVVAAPGVLANDSDPEGVALTAAVVTGPASGVLTFNSNGSFNYTPNLAFSGADSFTYRASDGWASSAVTTVSITVEPPPNVAPVAVGDGIYTTPFGTVLAVAAPGVLANDSDPNPGTVLTAVLSGGPANGGLTLNSDGSFSYTPNAGTSGADSFTYQASDGLLLSAVTTVNVSVAANLAPVAVGDSYSTAFGTALTVAAPGVLGNDSDPEGAALTAALVTGPTGGVLTLGPAGSFSYTPNPGFSGADSFTYTAGDGYASSAATTVTIAVAANQAPVTVGESYSTAFGAALTVAAPGVLANDSDPEGAALTASLVTGPTGGVLTPGPDGSFSYTPNPGFSGADSFTYTASDGYASSAATTVTIAVAANQAPVTVGESYSTAFATALTVAAPGVLGNDSDPEGAALTAALVTGPTGGVLTLNANGSFTYTPSLTFSGTDSFSYQANDTYLSSVATSVSITVAANLAPVAVNDTAATKMRTPVTIAVLANDSDPDGTLPLRVSIVDPPSRRGSAVVNADGTITYTPRLFFTGSETFTYRITDAGGAVSNKATVKVNVTR